MEQVNQATQQAGQQSEGSPGQNIIAGQIPSKVPPQNQQSQFQTPPAQVPMPSLEQLLMGIGWLVSRSVDSFKIAAQNQTAIQQMQYAFQNQNPQAPQNNAQVSQLSSSVEGLNQAVITLTGRVEKLAGEIEQANVFIDQQASQIEELKDGNEKNSTQGVGQSKTKTKRTSK